MKNRLFSFFQILSCYDSVDQLKFWTRNEIQRRFFVLDWSCNFSTETNWSYRFRSSRNIAWSVFVVANDVLNWFAVSFVKCEKQANNQIDVHHRHDNVSCDSSAVFQIQNKAFPFCSYNENSWRWFGAIDVRQHDVVHVHRDTCDWLFHIIQFQKWQNRRNLSTHNEVLWIKDKPEIEMSTLMKHNLEYFQNVFQNHVIAAYFFNARNDRLKKLFLNMLRLLS